MTHTKPMDDLRILLVENNDQAWQTFCQAFDRSPIAGKITRHRRAEDALEHLQDHAQAYDVVVVDEKLPDLSGLDLCHQLLEGGHNLPLVFLGDMGSEALIHEALQAGVDDYVLKDPEAGYLTLLPVVVPQAARRYRERQVDNKMPMEPRELPLLYQVGQELSTALDAQDVTEQLLFSVTQTLHAEGAFLWLWEKSPAQQHRLYCRELYNVNSYDLPVVDLYLLPGQGIAGWVAQHEESVALSNAPADSRFYPGIDTLTGLHTMSIVAVPLRGRESVIGVLEVINKREGDFSDDVPLVEMMATSAAIAIENAMLVKTLHQRTHELQVHNEELDAFAHTTAHDLQNLLGRIVGFSEALQQTHRDLSAAEIDRYLTIISKNGRKMSAILDALLLLASVRQEDVETVPLNMADIVDEALTRLSDLIEEHQAIVKTADHWPTVYGCASWVEEVWVNYLSNAIKYGGSPKENHPAQVELGASLVDPSVLSNLDHNQIIFWVRDHGAGITDEEQSRLFVPFERLHRSHIEGHGLGLSITKRIVEKLRGSVGVKSRPGEGSLFWFSLPAQEELDL